MSLKDEALQRLTLQSLAARDQYAFNLVLGQINQPGPRSNVLSALFLVSFALIRRHQCVRRCLGLCSASQDCGKVVR